MATIVLGAMGAALGSGMGGTLLGVSSAVIGRAVGATVGRVIDQRLLGGGSRPVETGRIDRLRLQTAGEGQPIARIWGQMRVPGHVIWAAPLEEVRETSGGGGGKGAPRGPQVTELSYRLSAAFALCDGPISGIGRVWADGEEIDPDELGMRVYPGDETQLPDACIAAHEGEDAPAYRGTAYVVVEGLGLERWGNRLPQLSFEVTRPMLDGASLAARVEAVAMIPGSGEYTLATTPVGLDLGLGETRMVNRNTPSAASDMKASLRTLGIELPKARSVSLVVSWFGDDLRCDACRIEPLVEQAETDSAVMPWVVGGLGRSDAGLVPKNAERPIYGGTPADASVIEALRAIAASGRRAMFYPFVLMTQRAGNGLPNPWAPSSEQPALPWRGRITCHPAPGQADSPDGTAGADAAVAAFMGRARASDFTRSGTTVTYHGPQEWSYRRFILHYAHLCAIAGGVETFVIGSELVGLTGIRGAAGHPMVEALRALAADVRGILPGVQLTYAADWTEYAGDHRNGEPCFSMDALWSSPDIDAIAIDNYLPLSDWRDGETHRDAIWGDIRNPDYLRSNVAGGELYDWYYAADEHRQSQLRTPITDGAGEPWIWRVKDLRGWWENRHFDRPGGVRAAQPTGWVPRSKPIWFTEFGCAALDKATNQPNKFLDALSSESVLPHFSDGRRDDAIQAAYVAAVTDHWRDPANNPEGSYGGPMVDLSRAHVWCWDARPFPAFPGRADLWGDGPAWARGHWLTGRAGACTLADVVRDLCRAAGLGAEQIDVSQLYGLVRGFVVQGGDSARSALQTLMLTYGFDVVEGAGTLRFRMRDGRLDRQFDSDDLAETDELPRPEHLRAPEAELSGRVRVSHVAAGADYQTATAEAILPDDGASLSSDSELPLALTRAEGQAVAERWLSEARVARDAVKLALPPSRGASVAAGDVIGFQGARWRVDRVERAGAVTVDAIRVEPGVYRPADNQAEGPTARRYLPPVPVWAEYLDLPLLRGDEVPHAPHIAVSATPWQGSAAVWSSADAVGGYALNRLVTRASVMGVTLGPLAAAAPGRLDRGAPLRVRVKGGELQSVSEAAMLSGANAMAIGDGSPDGWEVFQFATATLVSGGTWDLSGRLRGQAGTDALMPPVWPEGSLVVLLDGAPVQLDLAPSARGQLRHWRVGPALRGLDDPVVRERVLSFGGVGLRPLSPCHLQVGGGRLRWIRRTRIGADGWDGPDVPLGESREAYIVRMMRDGAVLAEFAVDQPACDVPPALWETARADGPFEVAVAQLSDLWGAGPFIRRTVDV